MDMCHMFGLWLSSKWLACSLSCITTWLMYRHLVGHASMTICHKTSFSRIAFCTIGFWRILVVDRISMPNFPLGKRLLSYWLRLVNTMQPMGLSLIVYGKRPCFMINIIARSHRDMFASIFGLWNRWPWSCNTKIKGDQWDFFGAYSLAMY